MGRFGGLGGLFGGKGGKGGKGGFGGLFGGKGGGPKPPPSSPSPKPPPGSPSPKPPRPQPKPPRPGSNSPRPNTPGSGRPRPSDKPGPFTPRPKPDGRPAKPGPGSTPKPEFTPRPRPDGSRPGGRPGGRDGANVPLDALDSVSQKLRDSADRVADVRSRIQTGIQNVFGPLGGPAFGSRLDDQLGRAQQALSSVSSGIQKASTGLRDTAKSYRDTEKANADGFRSIGDEKPKPPPMPGKTSGKPDLPDGSTSPSSARGLPDATTPGAPPTTEPGPGLKPDTSGPAINPPSSPGSNAPTVPSGAPKPSSPRNDAVGKDGMTTRSDPVDVVSGQVLFEQVDVELPAPLRFERLHLSSYRAGLWFGPSWTSTVDQRLELDSTDVCYFSPDGMILVYPRSAAGVAVLPVEGPRWPLTLSEDGSFTLACSAGELRFGPLSGRGRAVLPLLSITDRGGDRVEVDYDELGAPRLLRHSGGYRLELRTDAGRVTQLRVLEPDRDSGVVVTRYGYDQQGRLSEVVDSSGVPMVFGYDAEGRMTGWQDRNGSWYRYIYDAEGRCVRTVGDQGFLDGSFTYDRAAGVTTFTDSLGHRSEFHLNELNQVVREVDPLGGVTVSGWDRYDRLLSRTDPLGRTTGYEYGPDGELVAVVRPDGSRVRVDQRADGTMAISGSVVAGGGESSWERVYPAGAAPDVVNERVGVATGFHPSRQWGSEQPSGVPVERDLFGRARELADATGARTRLGWTVEGRKASRVGPLGRREEWRYDPEGNTVAYLGGPGRVSRFEYGPMGLPVASVDAAGARTTYGYDTELRLVRVTNPAGLSWHYRYDAVGRLVGETDFDGRVLRYDYDAAGQLVRAVNGVGEVTAYGYDALGNVIERRTSAATITYVYDPAGLLVRAADGESVLEIVRDEQGRVLRETVNGKGVSYSYDEFGIRRRTPSGVDSAWAFDETGVPQALTVAEHVVTFRHDAAGREIERITGAGTVLAQSFDAENQLTGQVVTVGERVVQQRRYQYQVDGQLVGVDDAVSGPVRFRLDPEGRVTDVTAPGGVESYRYDPSGNIVAAQLPAGPELGALEYDRNALTAAGSVRYGYDRQGRMITRTDTATGGSWVYSWDSLDRMTGVRTPDGSVWRYRYDPLGRRIAKQRLAPGHPEPAAGQTGPVVVEEVEFVWSGQLVVEQVHRDQHGQRLVTTWDYRPGTTRPVTQAERLGTGVRLFTLLTDQIGTPVDMIDPGGSIAWHNSASLWGRTTSHATAVSTPLRFPGQYADEETGLHYNVFRYYDPGTGRYLTQDPLGLTPAPNPVRYVSNPLQDSDPLGLGGCLGRPTRESGTTPQGAQSPGGQQPPSVAPPNAGHAAGNVQSANPPAAPANPPAAGPNVPTPSNSGAIRPSGQPNPNATPAGNPTRINPNDRPENIKALTRENESAQILAQHGYNIEQQPVVPGTTKRPDYRIEGEIFDNYAPGTANARNIASVIEGKVSSGQTERVVLNLADSAVDLDRLRNQLNTWPIQGLKEVIVIDRAGNVVPFYPNN